MPATLARVPRTVFALTVGVIAALISMIGSAGASYWGDEAASVMSATRPLHTLWPVLGNVDAVHGLYYVFLHGWIDIFGASEFSTRFPSALAVGAAATGLVLLVWRMHGPRLAIAAGLIFAILPRVTNIGSEARGYAIAVAGVVWVVYGLVCLLESSKKHRGLWWLWAVGLAITSTVFMYSLLILPVVGLWLLLDPARGARLWRTVRYGALAAALSLPIIAIGFLERGQIEFLGNRPPGVNGVLVTQWFGNINLAIIAWALILVAIVNIVLRMIAKADVRLPLLALIWTVLPPVILGLISIFSPSYSQRYLSMCTPAVAILIAWGIRSIAVRLQPKLFGQILGVALVLSLAVTGYSSYAAQRGPHGKDGSDLRQIAETIGAHAKPGDAVVFNGDIRPSRKPRLALRLYPEDFTGILDPGLKKSYVKTAHLWDETYDADKTTVPTGVDTVWYVISGPDKIKREKADLAHLKDQGFDVVDKTTLKRSWVLQLERADAH
ncbi:glycosyltransferase family 39 protein [Mycetocola lacteus]|nr:glycosyltransferase family 39 protein [Mycetocola lacteus]